jgi:MoaA/NifB/PqqE/SkfB family radical SAM enzyme
MGTLMITNGNDLDDSLILRLGRNVDLREEHFGSIIYRKKLFNLEELNHFGTLICRLIQNTPTTISALAASIHNEYGTSIEQAEDDLQSFLGPLVVKGFISIDDPAIASIPPETSISYLTFRLVADSLEMAWDTLAEQGFYSAPLQFHWEITHQCNLRCIHCYASASPTTDDSIGSDLLVDTLDWDRCLSLLNTLKGMGVVQVNFLGGEPMIERKFLPLLREATDRGFDIAFPTNGTLFTRTNLLELKELGMEYVTISLDSADPEVFEAIRGKQGIFDTVTGNIQLAKELGLGVIVNTVLTRKNFNGFEALIELLISHRVDILKVIDEFPVGRGLVNMEKLMLSPEEYQDFYKRMLLKIEPRYRDRLDIQLSPRFAIREQLGCCDNDGGDWEGNGGGDDTQVTLENPPVDYRCSAGRSQCFCGDDWDI